MFSNPLGFNRVEPLQVREMINHYEIQEKEKVRNILEDQRENALDKHIAATGFGGMSFKPRLNDQFLLANTCIFHFFNYLQMVINLEQQQIASFMHDAHCTLISFRLRYQFLGGILIQIPIILKDNISTGIS